MRKNTLQSVELVGKMRHIKSSNKSNKIQIRIQHCQKVANVDLIYIYISLFSVKPTFSLLRFRGLRSVL